MQVGKYKGIPVDQLPVSYCRWILGQDFPEEILNIAKKKVKESNTSQYEIDVTRHAIDKFSIRFLDIWKKERRGKNDGIASFLARRALEAYQQGEDVSKERHKDELLLKKHRDIIYAFNKKSDIKILITVMY